MLKMPMLGLIALCSGCTTAQQATATGDIAKVEALATQACADYATAKPAVNTVALLAPPAAAVIGSIEVYVDAACASATALSNPTTAQWVGQQIGTITALVTTKP